MKHRFQQVLFDPVGRVAPKGVSFEEAQNVSNKSYLTQ